jgi:hypothetical protein
MTDAISHTGVCGRDFPLINAARRQEAVRAVRAAAGMNKTDRARSAEGYAVKGFIKGTSGRTNSGAKGIPSISPVINSASIKIIFFIHPASRSYKVQGALPLLTH